MQSQPPMGEMAAVFIGETQAAAAIAPYRQEVSIAALNGPNETVISGTQKAVQAVVKRLAADGVKARRLAVSHAFHSPLMEPILDEFAQTANSVSYSPPRIAMVSNVTGGLVKNETAQAEYWRRHVRETVRFADGMQAVYEHGYRIFVEIGPNPVLLGLGRSCVPEGEAVW